MMHCHSPVDSNFFREEPRSDAATMTQQKNATAALPMEVFGGKVKSHIPIFSGANATGVYEAASPSVSRVMGPILASLTSPSLLTAKKG